MLLELLWWRSNDVMGGGLVAGQRSGREAVTVVDNTIHVYNEMGGPSVHRFDAVLKPDVDQAEAFEYVRPMIDSALRGYNATIFAYGQTV